jgi:Chromo (CHRromatin Organisation MOdifier) domain
VPIAILDRKIVKKGNAPAAQVLVKWSNTAEEESTWELYEDMKRRYPEFILEDKNLAKGRGMSGTEEMELETVTEFDFINRPKKIKGDGLSDCIGPRKEGEAHTSETGKG